MNAKPLSQHSESSTQAFGDMGLRCLQRGFIRNATGKFSPGDFPWRYSFCGYTLVPKNPTAMVIEDALEDARCTATGALPVGVGAAHFLFRFPCLIEAHLDVWMKRALQS